MKNPYPHFLPTLLTVLVFWSTCSAQTDSVVVTGRIWHLSARLYRESPTVFISRNNILQASRELVKPAPLNADGTFRVSLPLIFPQEEMYFTYGRISTAFLAARGNLSIDLDADSLFTSAVPFRFGGVNAQANGQFARYKAFEAAYPNKPDTKKLSNQVSTLSEAPTYRTVLSAYQAPFVAFSEKERPSSLLKHWVGYANRYNAAAFLYDKAAFENTEISKALGDSLRPSDQLLTAARASAMNRFAIFATQRLSTEVSRNSGLTVRALAILLERYGKNLTAEERIQLSDYAMKNSARASDLRFFDGLIKRSPDTLQRLVNYELLIQRSIREFDSTSVDYLAAYWFANSLPSLTLNFARLLYDYARPRIASPQLKQSVDELYQLEVKDSTRIRTAVQTLRQAGSRNNALEISPGIFVTRDDLGNGSSLLDQVINANRGKVVYLLLLSPRDESGRQAAVDAQRLRDIYRTRDLALVYVPIMDADKSLWPEIATRYNLVGDHLMLTESQLYDALGRLRSNNEVSATVINRAGKIVKRNAPLPSALDNLQKEINKAL